MLPPTLPCILFPLLLPKDTKIKHMEMQFCMLFYMGVKPSLSHLGKNRGCWLFQRREPRKMFASKTKQQRGGKNCTVRSLIICNLWQILFRSSYKRG